MLIHPGIKSINQRKKMKSEHSELKYENSLINEKSPYLLQHANNPVEWYPWGSKAFELARASDKPVFLSIGYSTCHWCHVMERESFENEEIADMMNKSFINIKVDREERPDIDQIYMSVCQMISGRGGWPLTIIMTPDKKPFFAGTYFPKESVQGRIGMKELILRISELWTENRDELENSAENITEKLNSLNQKRQDRDLNESVLQEAYLVFENTFDEEFGGFREAPKFPSPHNLLFLLRYWKATGEKRALGIVEKTLQAMRHGGIYDHIGFGFHRYSTDRRWLVPHFEKMLYDQAMLIMAYTETYLATQKIEFRETAEEIIEYLMRDMRSVEGVFFSAEDADSEGIEGKFYLWEKDEIVDILGSQTDEFIKKFNIVGKGNFVEESSYEENGSNILHLSESMGKYKKEFDSIRERLFEIREQRIHPYKDDKILTDWNGLVIAALSKAGTAFNNTRYIEAAENAAMFFIDTMGSGRSGLLHRYREDKAEIKGMLDDYAFMIWALLELYEATFNSAYLSKAATYAEYVLKHFTDNENGGFFFTADNGEELIARHKDVYDGAIPSGNSVMLNNLIKLFKITSKSKYKESYEKMVSAFSSEVAAMPNAYSMFLSGLGLLFHPSFEVVIAGNPQSDDSKNILELIRNKFLPYKTLVLNSGKDEILFSIAPFIKKQQAINGQATIYVCRNFSCESPTNDIGAALELLGENQ